MKEMKCDESDEIKEIALNSTINEKTYKLRLDLSIWYFVVILSFERPLTSQMVEIHIFR